MKSSKPFWKNAIWIIVIITLTVIVITSWLFHNNVRTINRELENIRHYENE